MACCAPNKSTVTTEAKPSQGIAKSFEHGSGWKLAYFFKEEIPSESRLSALSVDSSNTDSHMLVILPRLQLGSLHL